MSPWPGVPDRRPRPRHRGRRGPGVGGRYLDVPDARSGASLVGAEPWAATWHQDIDPLSRSARSLASVAVIPWRRCQTRSLARNGNRLARRTSRRSVTRSDTFVPSATCSSVYAHSVTGNVRGPNPAEVRKTNVRGRSTLTTHPRVHHRYGPIRLKPSKVAPVVPGTPSVHSQRWHSGLNVAMRGRSDTQAKTRSTDADITISVEALSMGSGLSASVICRSACGHHALELSARL